jgi:2-polyprenyl-3-methyl-5-hydroxy-6-metoxy-1,4-benzoquinol methylase
MLAGLYPHEYWWSEESKTQGRIARLFRRIERIYREFVTADHVRFLDSCARKNSQAGRLLLDIGCGSGTFLHVADRHGYIPHGMDVSARAVEIARRQYGYPTHQGEIGSKVWGDRRFDFITMFHVLEHLPNPRFGLRYAAGLLKSKGLLIIQVPNVSSLQARMFRSLWYGLDVPRHLINFTPKALGSLLREEGFEFQQMTRFSLRDNPASIASSVAPRLDPIGRKGRRPDTRPLSSGIAEITYFGLVLFALAPAYIESVCGKGGTIWVCARRREM